MTRQESTPVDMGHSALLQLSAERLLDAGLDELVYGYKSAHARPLNCNKKNVGLVLGSWWFRNLASLANCPHQYVQLRRKVGKRQ